MYYNFDNSTDEPPLNFYAYGFQNSRGFRALKVWLALQQAGKNGYIRMIGEDIELAKLLFAEAKNHPEPDASSQHLSITTFHYAPSEAGQDPASNGDCLNALNENLLNNLQQSGRLFLANAVVSGKYCLQTCIVNFRTLEKDIRETVEIIVQEGQKAHKVMRMIE